MARLGVHIEGAAWMRENLTKEIGPLALVITAEMGGVDSIVVTLTENFHGIKKQDCTLLKSAVKTHLNFHTPVLEDTVQAAIEFRPDMVTLIPGKRPGASQGGGVDILGQGGKLVKIIEELRNAELITSVLVDPNVHQIKAAAKMGVDYVELHLGEYAAIADLNERADQFENIKSVALAAAKLGLGVAAGQGINYHNAAQIASIAEIEEINAGHAVLARAVLIGMEAAVRDMSALVH